MLDQPIAQSIWFDNAAEEAARFYVSVFPGSRILQITRDLERGPNADVDPTLPVATVEFEIDGLRFVAVNAGSAVHMSEGISIQVFCETQAEIDGYWSKLSEGADPQGQQGGCLTDRYGVQWQVLPRRLIELLKDESSPQARRAIDAMQTMTKIDIARLEREVGLA